MSEELKTFSANIDHFVNGCIKSVNDIPNNDLVSRGKRIQQLFSVSEKLQTSFKTLSQFLNHEQTILLETIKDYENNLSQLKQTVLGEVEEDKKTWLSVVHPTKTNKYLAYITNNPAPRVDIAPAKRMVADNVFIDAYTIGKPEMCHNFKGHWCYLPEYNRFYLSINNTILEGMTANIIPAEVAPYKCLEHRNITLYGNTNGIDPERTKFYIPKEYDRGSKDVRQFTARMKFVPASKEVRDNEIYTYRLGSRDTLEQDIQMINPEDKRLYNDLVGNYLLCHTACMTYK